MARFTNQAQLRYGNAVTNSNIAVGEILEVLSATKTAVRNTYGQSDTVTYIVSIVNSGTTPITGISVTDNLGEYTFGTTTLVPLTYIDGTVKYYVNGVLQPSAVVTAGPPLVVSGITVPAGGSVTVAYEAAVNEFAPLDTTSVINNTAIVVYFRTRIYKSSGLCKSNNLFHCLFHFFSTSVMFDCNMQIIL